YADGKISEEEQRAIQDAQATHQEAKHPAALTARNGLQDRSCFFRADCQRKQRFTQEKIVCLWLSYYSYW
ncbi:hypothetical protein B9Z04_10635, partial [Staphylococcus aureus]|uniref:hypothetical protein n=1 Tax=Staphylococcus aureus TaxID=1280 RepID=UPI000C373F0E